MADKIQKRIGFYPGSFDPITLGHLDIINRAASFLDQLVIGVGVHHGKTAMFDDDTRVSMIREATVGVKTCEIVINTFDGLTVEAAIQANAGVIVRGIRNSTDFDYEMQMAGLNRTMVPSLETVLLPTSGEFGSISGTFVRQIAKMGGDVSAFVPKIVLKQLKFQK